MDKRLNHIGSDGRCDYYRPIHTSLEDDMAAEISRLDGELATLKATLGMVRRILGHVVAGTGSPADLARIIDTLGDVR